METKILITNKHNLTDKDVTEIVKRVKILLINSNNDVLLGYSHNIYQFPGGHVEVGETLIGAVSREIEEETGIILDTEKLEPFACAVFYYKDWPEVGQNRKNEIYYYEVKTDEHPNLDNTKYTDAEIEGQFELRYVPLTKVEEVLINNTKIYSYKKGIAQEMLKVFKIYKDTFK